MPVHLYPDYVVGVEILGSPHGMHRRSRMIVHLMPRPDWNESPRRIVFVMMNPSKATTEVSDKSVNAVIRYVYEMNRVLRDIDTVVILNLYTVYETASGNLGNIVEAHGFDFATGNDALARPKNDEILSTEAARAERVVAAWGRPNATNAALQSCRYAQRALEVLRILRPYPIYHMDQLRDEVYPKHPRGIHYDWVLTRLDVDALIDRMNAIAAL